MNIFLKWNGSILCYHEPDEPQVAWSKYTMYQPIHVHILIIIQLCDETMNIINAKGVCNKFCMHNIFYRYLYYIVDDAPTGVQIRDYLLNYHNW